MWLNLLLILKTIMLLLFIWLSFVSSLYILNISILSDSLLANIHSIVCLSLFLRGNFLYLIRTICVFFSFSDDVVSYKKKILASKKSQKIPIIFSSRSFIVVAYTLFVEKTILYPHKCIFTFDQYQLITYLWV